MFNYIFRKVEVRPYSHWQSYWTVENFKKWYEEQYLVDPDR